MRGFIDPTEMAEGRMNLAALQQRDPYITDIVDTASQVALYSFNSKTSEWVCVNYLVYLCKLCCWDTPYTLQPSTIFYKLKETSKL